jgi:hypothetical protein
MMFKVTRAIFLAMLAFSMVLVSSSTPEHQEQERVLFLGEQSNVEGGEKSSASVTGRRDLVSSCMAMFYKTKIDFISSSELHCSVSETNWMIPFLENKYNDLNSNNPELVETYKAKVQTKLCPTPTYTRDYRMLQRGKEANRKLRQTHFKLTYYATGSCRWCPRDNKDRHLMLVGGDDVESSKQLIHEDEEMARALAFTNVYDDIERSVSVHESSFLTAEVNKIYNKQVGHCLYQKNVTVEVMFHLTFRPASPCSVVLSDFF